MLLRVTLRGGRRLMARLLGGDHRLGFGLF
jgi:hypothetical protein